LDEQAITVSFGSSISPEVNSKVMQLNQLLQRQPFEGLVETVPAYCTLTVIYDAPIIKKSCAPGETAAAKTRHYLEQLLLENNTAALLPGSLHKIPVCYDTAFAPDLELMCDTKKMTVEDIILLHTAAPFHVYMIGFMPGFPYMGIVPDALQMPRLPIPRTHVPAGSVGIAGPQTGIYPFASPGGWNIIGQTPVKLFDTHRLQPCLLQAGDSVQFYAIDTGEFYHIKQQQP
jgi:inhibitor of KinA